MRPKAFTVSQVTLYVKQLVESDELLREVVVRGEITNFTRHSSGHLYFTLRDAESQLGCVLFRGSAQRLSFEPANGMAVVIGGAVEVYVRGGRYQLVARFMRPDGEGELRAELEALRAKLEAEGLFDSSRKRPLPRFPKCVALCTSPTGAAIRDLTTIISRRYPLARMVVFPTIVQGDAAVASIVASLQAADTYPGVDVIIVGRGGGSVEDLWAFNHESVVRAVFACHRPVVSAVGHETDTTLCDLVADARAATPSAAAELVVPQRQELLDSLGLQGQRLRAGLVGTAERSRQRLLRVAGRTPLRQPERLLGPWEQRLDEAAMGLADGAREALRVRAQRLENAGHRLAALGPQAVLERGYSVVQRLADGAIVSRRSDAPAGERLAIVVADGRILARSTGHELTQWTLDL